MPRKIWTLKQVKTENLKNVDTGMNLFAEARHSLRQNEDTFEPVSSMKKQWYLMCCKCGVYKKIRAPLQKIVICGRCKGYMDSIDYFPDHPSAEEVK